MKGTAMEKKLNGLALVALLAGLLALAGCRTAPVPPGGVGEGAEPAAPVQEEGARLFLLRWNPAVSSYGEEEFWGDFGVVRRGRPAPMDWNAWDWRDIREGDWALWCRVGGEADGVVGLWRFTGEVREGKSWRGDGKTLHYAEGEIMMVQEPAETGLFGAEEMASVAPELDWHGGHAGVRVDAAVAERLARHMADRLAHAEGLKKSSFAAVPSAKAGARCAVCALLSNLCPSWKAGKRLEDAASPADDEAWLPWPGDDVVYAPSDVSPGVDVADVARLVEWTRDDE